MTRPRTPGPLAGDYPTTISMTTSSLRASDSAKRPAEAIDSETQKHLILMSDKKDCLRFDAIDPADRLRSKDLDPTKATEDSVGKGAGEEAPHKIDDENEYSIQCFTEADIVNWKYWRPDLAPPAPVLAGYCGICKDLVDHIPLFCPNQILRSDYCGVCKKEADHDTFHCPTFTQDQVKFFAFCQFCNENNYHTTSKCPHAEFVYINGHKIPNVCCDCHKTGHVFWDCPEAESDDPDAYF